MLAAAWFSLRSLRSAGRILPLLLAGLVGVVGFVAAAANARAQSTAPVVAPPPGPPPGMKFVELNGHRFTLPRDFTLEVVAAPPLVDRPITASFDEQGRLYVADSSGSNDKVDKQLAERPHRILRLVDDDGDGKFDRRTVFADRMMFPEGTLWHDGSLYVAAPPSIWKLTDTDDDGVADERVEWFQGKTLTGCANDLHGPYLGRDGWIYWCKGAFAEQTYERPGRPPLVTKASHIFRCRPDGSRLEAVMTGGMDNPVDVVFTPGGERLFTTTFLQHPAGGRRDGMLHAVHGGVHGKVHAVIENHPRTGDVLPVLTHLGPAAPCGLELVDFDAFGPDYRHDVFACLFNMHKVTRHELEPVGASFRTRDSDFLVSSNIDFHPTDVLADADGSLLVVDTGGWYKLCCPTSQLWKPDILGAVYRVRRVGAERPADPRGREIAWREATPERLVELVGDRRFAVRDRAMAELGRRGDAALEPIARGFAAGKSADHRRDLVWTTGRFESEAARRIARAALADADATVRQAALQTLSLWRASLDAAQVEKLLPSSGPASHEARLVAEILGRSGDRSAVPRLLAAAGTQVAADPKSAPPSLAADSPSASTAADRFFEHALIYALVEIDDADATARGLDAASPWTRRAALLALDQMPNGKLAASRVAPFLSAREPVIRETAAWIVDRHPEWGDALAGYLRDELARRPLAAPDELQRQLAQFARHATIQQLLARTVEDSAASDEARRTALAAMRSSSLKETPASWHAALLTALAADSLAADAASMARAVPPPKTPHAALNEALVRLGRDSRRSVAARLDALAALPAGVVPADGELFTLLVGQLDPNLPVSQRTAAADILTRLKLAPDQLLALVERLAAAGPLEADRLLAAFEQSTDERIGLALTGTLKTSKILGSVRADTLKLRLGKYPASVQKEMQELLAVIQADSLRQKDRLDQLAKTLATGDVRRGHAVFHSAKAACASCHAMGYLGGRVGPDLTRIGSIRTERDLLESIVLPSASFVRSYEPVTAILSNGKTFNGLVKKELPGGILLATSAVEEVLIAQEDLEELRPSRVSVMPSGLDQQLSPQELADLIAFLKNAK